MGVKWKRMGPKVGVPPGPPFSGSLLPLLHPHSDSVNSLPTNHGISSDRRRPGEHLQPRYRSAAADEGGGVFAARVHDPAAGRRYGRPGRPASQRRRLGPNRRSVKDEWRRPFSNPPSTTTRDVRPLSATRHQNRALKETVHLRKIHIFI